MTEKLRWYDYISINIFWFALTSRSQVLTPLILPVLVQRFVGEAVKGAYIGQIRLWALMVALLMQALMGLLSDRSTSRWGRRRPFIAVGTALEVLVLVGIAAVARLEGMAGYWALFGFYILSMISSNTAHAATQGLIPDLVPQDQRGRFSGVKALLELPVPLVFASFVVAGMVAAGNLSGAILALIAVMVVCALVTMAAREAPLSATPAPFDWEPLLRLALMTAAFTVVILGMGLVSRTAMHWIAGLEGAAATPLMVIAGIVGMAVAVGVGVWLSVSIGLGREARGYRSFTWWVMNRLSFMVASTSLAGFMLYFLQERFVEYPGELAAGPAARVMLFVGVFILLTALPSGWLADRVGKRLLVAVSALLAGLGTLLILIIPTLPAMYAGGSLIGAAMGIYYTASWALGTEIVPQSQAGHFLGISNLAGAGAGAIGAYIGGPIADAHGYVVLFTIYGVMFVLSIVALAGIEEKAGLLTAVSGHSDPAVEAAGAAL
jgi:MFS family permease